MMLALHLAVVVLGLSPYKTIANEMPKVLQRNHSEGSLEGVRVRRGVKPAFEIVVAHKFIVVHKKMNWFKAREYCESIGLQMAAIRSENDHNRLVQEYSRWEPDTLYRVWLGGSNLASPIRFVWASLPPRTFSFTNWKDGQPDSYAEQEHCVEMFPKENYVWGDAPCEKEQEFVCQPFRLLEDVPLYP